MLLMVGTWHQHVDISTQYILLLVAEHFKRSFIHGFDYTSDTNGDDCINTISLLQGSTVSAAALLLF